MLRSSFFLPTVCCRLCVVNVQFSERMNNSLPSSHPDQPLLVKKIIRPSMCLHLNVIQPNAFSISLKQIPALLVRLTNRIPSLVSIIPRLFVAPINRLVSTDRPAIASISRQVLTAFVSIRTRARSLTFSCKFSRIFFPRIDPDQTRSQDGNARKKRAFHMERSRKGQATARCSLQSRSTMTNNEYVDWKSRRCLICIYFDICSYRGEKLVKGADGDDLSTRPRERVVGWTRRGK